MSPVSVIVFVCCALGVALGGLISPLGYGHGLGYYDHYPVYKAPAYSYANVYKVSHKSIPVVYTKPVVYPKPLYYKHALPSYHGVYPSYHDYSHHYPHFPYYH